MEPRKRRPVTLEGLARAVRALRRAVEELEERIETCEMDVSDLEDRESISGDTKTWIADDDDAAEGAAGGQEP